MQKWQKLGLVYCPDGEFDWLKTHAANPVVDHISGDMFRVYFSSRDEQNRSQICSLVMDLKNDKADVVDGSLTHVLAHGENGFFDDSGATVTGLIHHNSSIYLYYLGWNLCKTIPFRNAIGVAVSNDMGKSFVRYSKAPIIDRNFIDPISISYPFVLLDDSRYRVWYGSCEEWLGTSVRDYIFSIKYAESDDGINWKRQNSHAIKCNRNWEDAIARPHVIKDKDSYKMWYSKKKGEFYRIGYAESVDGLSWRRLDSDIDFGPSQNDWDSEMIEYPFVFDHNGKRYMLYNGNGYGKTGFGLAVLDG